MTTPNDPTMSHDSLDAVIAGYMLAVEADDVPNRQELVDQHPEHADALRAFFADLDRMDRVASPLRVAGGPDEIGGADANGHTGAPDSSLLRRLRAPGRDRPGWDGHRLQGPAGAPEPAGRAQDDPRRQLRLPPRHPSGSAPRPRRRPTSIIPTSCRSTRWASTRVSNTTR